MVFLEFSKWRKAMLFKIEKELLNHLETSEWKSLNELFLEIGIERNAKQGPHPLGSFISFFSKDWGRIISDRAPSFGELCVGLDRLKRLGWAEKQQRNDSPDVLERRGGVPTTEWRLTETGKIQKLNRTGK